jgi:stearoyl-CoA 9-desaturase NADPH oxidoreductase
MSTTNQAIAVTSRRGLRGLATSLLGSLSSPHPLDRYLEQINPLWSVSDVRAAVVAVRHETADSVTLTLRPNGNWQGFRAGQYVRVAVDVDGVRQQRCYSLACAEQSVDGLLEITAKRQRPGGVADHLFLNAHAGMVLTLSGAEGEFALPAVRPQRVLLIGGGSGVTPLMSMLRTLCDENHGGQISFLYYGRHAQDFIYREELERIAAAYPNVELLLAYTDSEGGMLQGQFSREQLVSAVPDYASAQTFMCGPGGLMDAVSALWQQEGIEANLHLERFTAPIMPAAAAQDVVTGEVRFVRSERYAANNGASLLDQAEAAGLRPESGCRMGICHTCTCRKSAGVVRNLQTGELSSGEEEIRLCVSVPVGDVTLDI